MSQRSVRYSKLTREVDYSTGADKYIPEQFEQRPTRIPWRAIFVATVLFVLGSVLITIGILLLTGQIDAQYSDRTWPVLTIGLLTFIPGFYHIRVAYYAWLNYDGYSFDDIPDYND